MNQVFDQIYTKVWNEVFAGIKPLDQEAFKNVYTKDIQLPKQFACALSGTPVYSGTEYGYKKFMSQEENKKRMNTDNFMEPRSDIPNFAGLLGLMKNRSLFRGSRSINSELVEESDDIYSSSYIYQSTHIYSCQKVMYCYNTKTSEYLLASKGSGDCSFGIRIMDSGNTSNSFDVHWSGKCAHTYFSHDCYDLRDCMFCFHIVSKQYCIGNMQFTEDEYKTMKEKLLKEYFAQLASSNAFVSINQL